MDCPQCGEPTEELHEGYCKSCCDQNQRDIDLHNAFYDRWRRMNERQREDEIKRAVQ